MDLSSTYPKVSIILPVRNGLPFLPLAVHSILNQTFRNFELIVIDDGSTDGGPDGLAETALLDGRLKIISNPGCGLVQALNYGISQARGVFIARMDADDIALPNRLELQTAFLEANPSITVLGTQVAPIDESGHPAGKMSNFPTNSAAISSALFDKGCVLHHPSIMARREAVVAIGCYRAALTYAEDFDLWLRMSERYQLANLADVTLLYRHHTRSVSGSFHKEQQLAHSLALVAAKRRRRGLADPIDNIVLLTDDGLEHDFELSRLLQAHKALNSFLLGERSSTLSQLVMDGVVSGFFAHGRRRLVIVLYLIAKQCFMSREFRLAWRAARLSMRLDFFRSLKLICLQTSSAYETGLQVYDT